MNLHLLINVWALRALLSLTIFVDKKQRKEFLISEFRYQNSDFIQAYSIPSFSRMYSGMASLCTISDVVLSLTKGPEA